MNRPSRSALAESLVDALAEAGADTIFGLPGGGPNLDVIGAAVNRGFRFVLAHAETEAAIMASTYGLIHRAPAAVIVTRGPGAASVTNGLAQATLDRYPLVVVTDTVPARSAERVAHQRIDQRSMLTPVAKASSTVTDATPLGELRAAVASATTWPYGGIHLDADPGAEPAAPDSGPPDGRARLVPGVVNQPAHDVVDTAATDVAMAIIRLAAAERPLVIVGMEAAALDAASSSNGKPGPIGALLQTLGAPVLTTYQAIGLVPTEGPLNAGLFTNGALERPVLDEADVVLTVGLDLVEPIPAPWDHRADVIRLSAVVQTDEYVEPAIDLVGDVVAQLSALVEGVGSGADTDRSAGTVGAVGTSAETHRGEARRRLTGDGRAGSDDRLFGPLDVVTTAARHLPADATTTVDAGAHFLAVMPMWPVSRPFGLLISNGLATMGFAVPAAIGAALARPGSPVLALTGDGGLSMVLAELETIARLDLPITVIVFNDAALSLIEIKQGDGHGGHDVVRYDPVDYAAIASASGLEGQIVRSGDELEVALTGGWDRPRLIDARIDPSIYPHLIAATRG